MKVYSLTKTLDEHVDFYTTNKEEAEVLVVGGSKIELNDFPNLKYIFKCGVGVDNIPSHQELCDRGVILIRPSVETQNTIFEEVSQFTIYSILKAHYHNSEGSINCWAKPRRDNLSDKRALVIGAQGNIGMRVGSKLKEFIKPENVITYDVDSQEDLGEEITKADIITLHIPLTSETKNIIDVNKLKKDVILINTSRGQLVNEIDLYGFLAFNNKAVAAFDVFWKEPYDGRLLNLKNFIATPHIASSSKSFIEGLYRDLTDLLGKTYV